MTRKYSHRRNVHMIQVRSALRRPKNRHHQTTLSSASQWPLTLCSVMDVRPSYKNRRVPNSLKTRVIIRRVVQVSPNIVECRIIDSSIREWFAQQRWSIHSYRWRWRNTVNGRRCVQRCHVLCLLLLTSWKLAVQKCRLFSRSVHFLWPTGFEANDSYLWIGYGCPLHITFVRQFTSISAPLFFTSS